MTDINLTEIVAIIDRSGSMVDLVSETIGGYNSFLKEQKKAPGKANITLVQFDDKYQIDYDGVDINDAKELDEKTYVPRGMTALLDAVGKTIITVGERLSKAKEEERPGQVIFLIITDGLENSSREFVAEKVSEMIKHQTDKYNWTFTFLGGGDAAFNQAKGMGVNVNNSYNYATVNTSHVYKAASAGVSRRRDAASKGIIMTSNASLLTDQEAREIKIESKT
jgi:uncharacterized protein YegL